MGKKSGPNPPHGGAVVTVKSGPHPPHGSPPPVTSGPNPPHGGLSAVSQSSAATGTAAAAAEETEAEPGTREDTVSLRLSIPKPEPFSVFVKSDKEGGVQIDSIEIRICKEDQPVFSALSDSDARISLKPNESHVFLFSEEQLKSALPHIEAGESVEVKVHYVAPDNSEVQIGIIEKRHHHTLGEVIKHFFH